MDGPKAKIGVFLLLTVAFSMLVWAPLAAGRPPLFEGQFNGLALMWAPGLAAIITRLLFQRDLRGMGWIPRSPAILLLALVLPILYALPVYLLAWGTGLGAFDPHSWTGPGQPVLVGLAQLVGFGVLTGLIAATGEEIGWRGFLVPELDRLMSFRRLALVSGLIWATWHMPMMVLAGYSGSGTPVLYSILCFYVMIIALGTVMAWMTFRTRSFWPAALLHATHNLFVQAVFDSATDESPLTNWWTGEFGAGLAITVAVAAWLLVGRARLLSSDGAQRGGDGSRRLG